MTTKDAAWWRDYRAQKKADTEAMLRDITQNAATPSDQFVTLDAERIKELEGNNRRLQETIVFLDEEIVRLKRELALRATPTDVLQPVVYQPTILPPTRPDDRPIGTFGAPRPAPKPAPRKR